MVSTNYLNKVRNNLKTKVEDIDFNNITIKDKLLYRDYVISSIYTLIPPRRIGDYSIMKSIQIEHYNNLSIIQKKKNNYILVKKKKLYFIFFNYKTSRYYGKQEFEIKGILKNILLQWIKINPSNDFLINRNNLSLSSNNLGKIITNIFSNEKHPNISINILRHSFITNKFKIIENLKERKEIAIKMGNSVFIQNDYIKN